MISREDLTSGPTRETVEAWLRACQLRWPGIDIDLERLVPWLADRCVEGTLLERLCGEDLVLACAGAAGDPVAWKALDQLVASEVRRVLPRHRLADVDDLHQAVCAKLVRSGMLAEYRGLGPIHRWLRMTTLRTHLDVERAAGRRPTVAVPDDELAELATAADDPALAFLKHHYRATVRAALGDAISELPAADRILLRQHYVAGLTVDQLTGLYEIHRVTTSRRLAAARAKLGTAVRTRLTHELGLPPDELDGVLQLVESNLGLSLHRLLEDR